MANSPFSVPNPFVTTNSTAVETAVANMNRLRKLDDISAVNIYNKTSYADSRRRLSEISSNVAQLKQKTEQLQNLAMDLRDCLNAHYIGATRPPNGCASFSQEEAEDLKLHILAINNIFNNHLGAEMMEEFNHSIATKKLKNANGVAIVSSTAAPEPDNCLPKWDVSKVQVGTRRPANQGPSEQPTQSSAQTQQPAQARAKTAVEDEQRGTKRKANEMDK